MQCARLGTFIPRFPVKACPGRIVKVQGYLLAGGGKLPMSATSFAPSSPDSPICAGAKVSWGALSRNTIACTRACDDTVQTINRSVARNVYLPYACRTRARVAIRVPGTQPLGVDKRTTLSVLSPGPSTCLGPRTARSSRTIESSLHAPSKATWEVRGKSGRGRAWCC